LALSGQPDRVSSIRGPTYDLDSSGGEQGVQPFEEYQVMVCKQDSR
jgi:hypothetical protein